MEKLPLYFLQHFADFFERKWYYFIYFIQVDYANYNWRPQLRRLSDLFNYKAELLYLNALQTNTIRIHSHNVKGVNFISYELSIRIYVCILTSLIFIKASSFGLLTNGIYL